MNETKIETLYVFVSVDDVTGQEGLIAYEDDSVWRPFLTAKEENLSDMKEIAEMLAELHNKPIRLATFIRAPEVS